MWHISSTMLSFLLLTRVCVLSGLVGASPNCTNTAKGVCFGKHDENKIIKADSEAACCAACGGRATCKVASAHIHTLRAVAAVVIFKTFGDPTGLDI